MSAPVASPTPGVEDDLDAACVLQRALYRAAKPDPGRRFHALYDKVHRRDVLERAWEQVRRNAGAPGIDQTTITDVEEYGVDRLPYELVVELRERTFKPLPARRVNIPKPGRDELRPLSIPAIRDRVVQTALKVVPEMAAWTPSFERATAAKPMLRARQPHTNPELQPAESVRTRSSRRTWEASSPGAVAGVDLRGQLAHGRIQHRQVVGHGGGAGVARPQEGGEDSPVASAVHSMG